MSTLSRRGILFGVLCAASFGLAEYLRPKTPLQFTPSGSLDELVPKTFGSWTSRYDATLVTPPSEDSLTGQLYDDLLMRRYFDAESEQEIFLLAAYGASQTDDLQLHRPESCYPAVGLPITARAPDTLAFADRQIPAVSLTSQVPGRIEDIFYWSRLGDRFPTDAGQQRSEKLDLAFAGQVPDGILVRVSTVRRREEDPTADVKAFCRQMLDAMPAEARKVLIA